eukprot:GHVU01132799.1.p5 GENE.GHVU01132799.1~~GHVU01132799.1.p5  ORF type:complete len:107 (-),score=12.13 GHVU01132799.1:1481-1801(-)
MAENSGADTEADLGPGAADLDYSDSASDSAVEASTAHRGGEDSRLPVGHLSMETQREAYSLEQHIDGEWLTQQLSLAPDAVEGDYDSIACRCCGDLPLEPISAGCG